MVDINNGSGCCCFVQRSCYWLGKRWSRCSGVPGGPKVNQYSVLDISFVICYGTFSSKTIHLGLYGSRSNTNSGPCWYNCLLLDWWTRHRLPAHGFYQLNSDQDCRLGKNYALVTCHIIIINVTFIILIIHTIVIKMRNTVTNNQTEKTQVRAMSMKA